MSLTVLQREIRTAADREKAKFLQRFFKTGEGEYGYGDVFLGLTVPQARKIATIHNDLPFEDIERLLQSKYHEERLIALLLLVANFKTSDKEKRKKIYEFYLSHTKFINNWDLVDLSAEYIVGEYLLSCHSERSEESHKQRSFTSVQDDSMQVLSDLAHSDSLWERRIAIMSTYAFIKYGSSEETFHIAELLLQDREDLIHKAVGWMLREVGKRVSQKQEEEFLKKYYKLMPRTMLRYAIERFPESRRKHYLSGIM